MGLVALGLHGGDAPAAFADADLDGVPDSTDECPTDPSGSVDADEDGICDSVDLCCGDNSFGDTDGDGICEDLDACLGDDASGDTDGDFVCNDRDLCAATQILIDLLEVPTDSGCVFRTSPSPGQTIDFSLNELDFDKCEELRGEPFPSTVTKESIYACNFDFDLVQKAVEESGGCSCLQIFTFFQASPISLTDSLPSYCRVALETGPTVNDPLLSCFDLMCCYREYEPILTQIINEQGLIIE